MLTNIKNLPSAAKLDEAFQELDSKVNHTAVLQNDDLDKLIGATVFLKAEHQQIGKAFKIRGATFALSQLEKQALKKGVATHSSGNHAAALAIASNKIGVKAYIVMPETAKKSKVQNVLDAKGEIIFCENSLAAREASLEELVEKKGATFIPPYDHWDIIAGQATAAMELIKEVSDLDLILCPIGGGGLISGTALAAYYFAPKLQVIGCEPTGADDAYRSFHDGQYFPQEDPNTVCDGLRTSMGHKNWFVIREYVKDVLKVGDESILEAQAWVKEHMKQDIEVSSAVVIATLFEHADRFKGKKVGVIITGGNL